MHKIALALPTHGAFPGRDLPRGYFCAVTPP
jgi:hypothetical protein